MFSSDVVKESRTLARMNLLTENVFPLTLKHKIFLGKRNEIIFWARSRYGFQTSGVWFEMDMKVIREIFVSATM